jgi:hypothetical protein
MIASSRKQVVLWIAANAAVLLVIHFISGVLMWDIGGIAHSSWWSRTVGFTQALTACSIIAALMWPVSLTLDKQFKG